MNSEIEERSDSTETAVPDSSPAPGPVYGFSGATGFYRARTRFYLALLVFVVVVGLPIISVPGLRHRLSTRVQTLREAMSGGGIKPVTVIVGENKEPFPAQYAKKVGPPNYPKLPPYLSATQGLGGPIVSATPVPSRATTRRNRTIKIPTVPGEPETQAAAADSAQVPASGQDASGTEAQPKYQQGVMEKEAYDFLLSSNATVKGMVQGSNPSLRFKSWDALKRDEDTYWVRLTFSSVPGGSNEEYIWQVKLLAKQVSPLSYNARTLASP